MGVRLIWVQEVVSSILTHSNMFYYFNREVVLWLQG